jgi:hypothetical protein
MNTTSRPETQSLIAAWSRERKASAAASRRGDDAAAWAHLERAHILSQPLAGRHVRTHLAMLRFAVRTGRVREVVGQTFRVLVAAPGSWSGRYPVGNTGGSDVSAFVRMPVPADLRALLQADAKAA